jgi:hypothetical protein
MRKRVMLAVAGLALATSTFAQDSNRWIRLGQSDLDPRGDRVEIRLRARIPIEALVLGVDNASVRILAARVQLENGRVIDWPIRGAMYPSQRTQVFQLPGRSERRVKRVVLYYETGHNRRRAHAEQDRPWDKEMAPWEDDRGPGRNLDRESPRRETQPPPPVMGRDRGPDGDSRWNRDWDPNWDRDYGRYRPKVVVWGRD